MSPWILFSIQNDDDEKLDKRNLIFSHMLIAWLLIQGMKGKKKKITLTLKRKEAGWLVKKKKSLSSFRPLMNKFIFNQEFPRF